MRYDMRYDILRSEIPVLGRSLTRREYEALRDELRLENRAVPRGLSRAVVRPAGARHVGTVWVPQGGPGPANGWRNTGIRVRTI